MIAVTVISPSYRKVGGEAIRRMRRYAGLDVYVIECSDAEGFQTKLSLDQLCPKKPVLFFDADVWSLRDWTPQDLAGAGQFFAVHDPAVWNPHTFCHHDTHKNGLDSHRYFNSGVFIWNNQFADHREIFKIARRSWKAQQRGEKHYEDKTDQAHLNFGLIESGVPLQWLPLQYNCYCFSIRHGQFSHYPRDIINLHGAGIPAKKKHAQMKVEAQVFGEKIYPMHHEAILWEYHRNHSLR